MMYSGWSPSTSCQTASQQVGQVGCPDVKWFWVAAAVAIFAAMSKGSRKGGRR